MKIFSAIFFFFLSSLIWANTHYIKDLQRVTFRSGPGIDHRVIKMLNSGDKLQIVEDAGEWIRVKDQDGVDGYVMKRFITKDIPFKLRYNWEKSKLAKMGGKLEEIDQLKNDLTRENTSLKTNLSEAVKKLEELQKQYDDLEKGSKNYLQLKEEMTKMADKVVYLDERSSMLEKKQLKQYIIWFAVGAGILLIGLFLGGLYEKSARPRLKF